MGYASFSLTISIIDNLLNINTASLCFLMKVEFPSSVISDYTLNLFSCLPEDVGWSAHILSLGVRP